MRSFFASALVATLALAGCGGNVSTGNPGGAGGNGGAGGTTGTTTGSSSSSGSTTGTTTGSTTGTTTGSTTGTAQCSGPGQCVMALPGCCAPCGIPEASDFVGVHQDFLDEHNATVCAEPEPCPDCPSGLNPHLFAACHPGDTCAVLDVRIEQVSLCNSDADCYLRVGTTCCEPCDAAFSHQLTAVSSAASPTLHQLVCPPNGDCPPCAPQLPPDAFAYCGGDGHCAVGIIDSP